jgi:DNA-binding MarR family transcriptional regulator
VRPLGSTQRNVLLALDELEDPPTASEIAERISYRMRRRHRPTADAENAGKTLLSLERRGLVVRTGVAFRGRCWGLTEDGTRAVEQIHKDVR